MSDSQVGLGAARMALLAFVAFACGSGSAAGDPAGGAHLLVLPGLSAGQSLKAETVRFADPRHRSVQVMRGALRPEAAPPGVEFLDVGGGNRFDLRENRLLGRAYLAQMFQRYGNWSDALAAYNWGPGNLEAWIAAGRPAERLPSETARYVRRVLRDALVASANRW